MVIRFVIVVLTGLFITAPPVLGQMRLKVKDLLLAPEKYYNQTVILEGMVREIQHSEGLFMGYYILECHFGGNVNVYSKSLPAPGANYQVTAVINPGKDPKSYRIEEIKRKRPGSYVGMIILGSLISVMGIVFVLSMKNTSGRVSTSKP